ncbi:MAG: hypothetical protein JOY61_06260 [Chloroflexi bacterium]|nr:hypothetical protein [Chloroflexota bacterium]
MFKWAVLSAVAVLLVASTPAAAQQVPSAPGAGAWAPGPAASGDRNQMAGVIDAPSNAAGVTGTSLQVTGWFVDLSAQGWAGADDVEIFSGTMETGKPLAHALFAQNRPDVANALKTPFWAASGWGAVVPTTVLPTGPVTLSVYVHTPNKGWWVRQVSVSVRPGNAPPPTTPAPSIYGNDISSPQCPTNAEPPPPAFAIVGVTGGRPFTPNACLPREFAWALSATSANQPRLGFYMNTADPGTASPRWPSAGTSAPRACDGSWNADCAYDYGWLMAQDAFSRATGVAGGMAAQAPWWLDVEAANSWSPDMNTNAAALQGALAFLQSQNVTNIGVYSTSTDWEALIGQPAPDGPFGALLNWRPGPGNPQEAPSWCSRTVTGGRVKYVQFPNAGFDTDLACY